MPPINIIGTADFTMQSRYGLSKQERAAQLKTRNDTFPALRSRGLTLQEIGDLHGITRQAVQQILKKRGYFQRINNQSEYMAQKIIQRHEKIVAAKRNERKHLDTK